MSRCPDVPAVTISGPLANLRTALYWPKGKGRLIVVEGYQKYKSRLFQIPQLDHWAVFVSGDLLPDLRKAPDDVLSFNDAAEQALHTTYTHGVPLNKGSYHINVIKEQLESSMKDEVCDALFDETSMALSQYLGEDNSKNWAGVKALKTIQTVITRVNNRIWVGGPKCRDTEYMDQVVKFAIHVMVVSQLINTFPDVLKPVVGTFLSWYNPPLRAAEKHIKPMIIQREEHLNANGRDWDQLPDDMLSWLMRYDPNPGPNTDYGGIIGRLMNINLASTHTTTMVVCHVLYEICTRPEDAEILREEVLEEVRRHGRTSVAYNNMVKLDSYIKESMRHTGIGLLTGRRKALKPFTFSDGSRVPKGTFLYAAAWAVHHDEEIYNDAGTFDGFRFARSAGVNGTESRMQALVAPSDDFLPFGIGKHICVSIASPGRFYATAVVKTVISYILEHYEIKVSTPTKPPDVWIGTTCLPNPKAE
ncbi:cytochrome P450 [Hysterangium stoloniferum]|nr:cytochrome P450 [Hysterangium stoloniferum]